MKNSLSAVLSTDRKMVKTAFLSYYISMYNCVSRELGYDRSAVTVDEIYDFLQDLRHEEGKRVPEISKEDISYCFWLLSSSGVCRA
ncbi:MAG: hypothetical protein MN733_32370 [Nitrososphaera sp.]|nr:hypothetical protein [Nitrososphaera sp.]